MPAGGIQVDGVGASGGHQHQFELGVAAAATQDLDHAQTIELGHVHVHQREVDVQVRLRLGEQEVERLVAECRPLEAGKRRDLTDLEFISIDTVKTQDIDDALYAQISSTGWSGFLGSKLCFFGSSLIGSNTAPAATPGEVMKH